MLTLVYRFCATPTQVAQGTHSWELYWNHETKKHKQVTVPNGPTCSRYVMPVGTVIDQYCDDQQFQVTVVAAWDGVGRPPMPYKYKGSPGRVAYTLEYEKNGPACTDGRGGANCGLQILDVQYELEHILDSNGQPTPGGWAKITIITNEVPFPVEYSLNSFHSVQDSPIFERVKWGWHEGDPPVYGNQNDTFVAKARPKGSTQIGPIE